jgi:hypothetical protein
MKLLLLVAFLCACLYAQAPVTQTGTPSSTPPVATPKVIQPISVTVDGKTWSISVDPTTYGNLAKKAAQIRQPTVGDLIALAVSTTIRQLATDPNTVSGKLADLHAATQASEAAEQAAKQAAVTVVVPK